MALAPLARESREQEEAGGLVGKVRDGRNGGAENRREHMFDKVVTPSDVGKLNRLVVPKHFAERYFPAARGNPTGTVLCFEDAGGEDAGRVWRFRYSYWSSSQSYVMTKGWSGFVRDKRLAAGDTVSFCRGAGARLFIDCRRRHRVPAPAAPPAVPSLPQAPAARGRCLRLFGVDLEPGVDRPLPVLLDLQLALRR